MAPLAATLPATATLSLSESAEHFRRTVKSQQHRQSLADVEGGAVEAPSTRSTPALRTRGPSRSPPLWRCHSKSLPHPAGQPISPPSEALVFSFCTPRSADTWRMQRGGNARCSASVRHRRAHSSREAQCAVQSSAGAMESRTRVVVVMWSGPRAGALACRFNLALHSCRWDLCTLYLVFTSRALPSFAFLLMCC